MSFSGILVRAVPAELSVIAQRLGALSGVRVHQTDPEGGRLVLTLEASSGDEEINGLRRIQQVPGVVSADLVYHRIADDQPESLATRDPASPQNTHRGETP